MARSAKPRKHKSLVRRSDPPRYVVKLHDDEETGEDAAVLRFDAFDDAVSCCADLNIPFFVDDGNKKLVFWFVRTDDYGHTEIARCTEREFASLAAHISAGAWYCPDCGTVHGVSLDIGKFCTIRASPACQRRCLWFLSAPQLKIKGRDCGTINGHNESLSIRTLMKDAREALVR